MGTVTNFPKWKENVTAIERMQEIIQYAESKPAEVQHVVVVWVDSDGDRQCAVDSDMTLGQALGMLELVKYDILAQS